jgi:nitrilase
MRHIARESRCYVISACVLQRASSHPAGVPLADGPDIMDRGGSAILAPDGSYLAGPLWDEPGILYAELDPDRLAADRQRFDAAGHYNRPDVFQLSVRRPD